MAKGVNMETYFLWGGIGILFLFLLIGFLAGFIRGLKRSALHIIFFVVSFVVAFFITKPIATAVLGISIPIDGAPTELNLIVYSLLSKNFDLQNYETAGEFLKSLPRAVVSPILFIFVALLTYFVFDIIYLIVARIWFKKKKVDFSKNKPRRWYGSAVGVVEGFLFMFLIFAPLTSLTKTYEKIVYTSTSTSEEVSVQEETDAKLKPISEYVKEYIPSTVDEIIVAFNHSVVGQVSGAGGMNDALFDGLSNVKINDENIKLREEIVVVAETYDEFVDVYNNFSDRNWDKIDLTQLKANVKKFIENGLFKGVVAQTVADFVNNYETSEKLPEMLNKLILKIKDSEKFKSTYKYLTDDITKLLDAADEIVKNDFIKDYESLTDKSLTGILKFVDSKSQATKDLAEDVFKLNVVHDGFETFVDFASQKLADVIKNEDPDKIIALNSGVDPDTIIDKLLEAVDKLLTLDEQLPIADLISAEDKLDVLTSLQDEDGTKIESALTLAGETFDFFAEMEIFQVEGQSVFDNILSTFDLKIKTSKFYDAMGNEKSFENYSQFFNHIKTPVKNAIKMNLLELANGKADFKDALDNILAELGKNTNLLKETIMPFYGLQVFDLNNLVFEEVKTQLTTNLKDVIDISGVDGFAAWSKEYENIGEVLNTLNRGEIEETEGTTKTYIEYLLDQNGGEMDVQKLLKEIMKRSDGSGGEKDDLYMILQALFKSRVFQPLYKQMFEYLDQTITDRTGVDPKTDYMRMIPDETYAPDKAKDKLRENAIKAISKMLDIVLDLEIPEGQQMKLQVVGQLLDILRENAYNDGTKDGIFNNIFVNLIWYITGEDLTTDQIYTDKGYTHLDKAADIKQLLENSGITIDKENIYSSSNNFTEAMKTADDIIALAKNLSEKFSSDTFSGTEEEFVQNIKDAVDELGPDVDPVEVVEKAKDVLNVVDPDLLDKDFINDNKAEIESEVEKKFKDDPDMQQAIKDFLDVKEK